MVGKLVASELLEPLLWKLFDAAKAQKAIAKEVAEDEDEEDEEDKEDKDSLPTWKTRDDEFPFWIKHISIQSITGIINEQNCAWDPTYFDWFMRVAVRLSIFRSALWSLFWICYRFAMYINFAGHILVLQTILAAGLPPGTHLDAMTWHISVDDPIVGYLVGYISPIRCWKMITKNIIWMVNPW